jgi:hypothetical protein
MVGDLSTNFSCTTIVLFDIKMKTTTNKTNANNRMWKFGMYLKYFLIIMGNASFSIFTNSDAKIKSQKDLNINFWFKMNKNKVFLFRLYVSTILNSA